jgi:hypothetical protein
MTVSLPPRANRQPGVFVSCPGERVIDSEVLSPSKREMPFSTLDFNVMVISLFEII